MFGTALFIIAVAIYGQSDNTALAGPVGFNKFLWNNGFTCPDNLTSFKIVETIPLAECLLKCQKKSTCIGVKYEPFRIQCTGCRWYLPKLEPIQTPGLAHFNRDGK
jgi:hypothetical protein